MCMFKSGVAVKTSEDDVKVYTLKGKDSHTEIHDKFNIRDDDGVGARLQTPVELIPVRGLDNLEDYDFIFDDKRPGWWVDAMTSSAKKQLWQTIQEEYKNNRIVYEGDLNLRSLTTLPKGVTLKAGGYLYLSSLTTLPKGVTLKATQVFISGTWQKPSEIKRG